jgi:hypothetical protein
LYVESGRAGQQHDRIPAEGACEGDTVADDWHRRIKPRVISRRAMARLQARGRGILLLHDIHAATVVARPELLKQLKDAGFRVVHVAPAPVNRMEIAGDANVLAAARRRPTPRPSSRSTNKPMDQGLVAI